MFRRLCSFLVALWRKKTDKADRLYYLDGIKPINASKMIIDECTVTKN